MDFDPGHLEALFADRRPPVVGEARCAQQSDEHDPVAPRRRVGAPTHDVDERHDAEGISRRAGYGRGTEEIDLQPPCRINGELPGDQVAGAKGECRRVRPVDDELRQTQVAADRGQA